MILAVDNKSLLLLYNVRDPCVLPLLYDLCHFDTLNIEYISDMSATARTAFVLGR